MTELYIDASSNSQKVSVDTFNKNKEETKKLLLDYHRAEEQIRVLNPNAEPFEINLTKQRALAKNKAKIIDIMDGAIKKTPELKSFQENFRNYLKSLFQKSYTITTSTNMPNVQLAYSKGQQISIAVMGMAGELLKGIGTVEKTMLGGMKATGLVSAALLGGTEYFKHYFDKKQNTKFYGVTQPIIDFMDSDDIKAFTEAIARFATMSLAPTILDFHHAIQNNSNYSDEDKSEKLKLFQHYYIQNLAEQFLIQISQDAMKRDENYLTKYDLVFHKNNLEKFLHFYLE